MQYSELLIAGASSLNISLSDQQVQQFYKYMKLLVEWNEKINLTAITEEKEIVTKHFVDSISVSLAELLHEDIKIIDVGTGAGFPGIPIKIAYPQVNVTLLDSLNKRVNFMNEVIKELNLSKIEAVHGRAEDFGINKSYRENYDMAISRAVANLPVLLELCLPFVKVGGYFISMKGPDVTEEIGIAEKAIKILGGELVNICYFVLPETDIKHSLIIIKKISQSPTRFPRKAGKPAKEPIL